jgi:hypothetical protein
MAPEDFESLGFPKQPLIVKEVESDMEKRRTEGCLCLTSQVT